MANYTWSVKSRRVYEWRTNGHPLIDGGEITKMIWAAEAKYREVYGLSEAFELADTALWWFGDEDGSVGIRFETTDEADEAAMRVAKLCDEQEAHCSLEGIDVPSWVASVREALKGAAG